MGNDVEFLIKRYGIQNKEQFKEYINKAKIILTTGKKPSNEKTLTIVGGQAGSGKTTLITIAKNEFDDNAVILDLVELMAIHPSYKTIVNKYPQKAYWIIQKDIDALKIEMENYIIDNEYNVINEAAFRRAPQIIKLCEKFANNGYDINLKLLAVPKLNSLGSIFTRYASKLMLGKSPRWVELQAHDDSYEGVISLTEELFNRGLVNNSEVYVRGKEHPEKIYSSQRHEFLNAIEAIRYGREKGRKDAVDSFEDKYVFVRSILAERQPELLDRLDVWKKLYEKERKYVYRTSDKEI